MKNASKSLKTVLRDRITKSELILYSDLKKVGFGSGERSTVSFDELDRMISVWKIKVDQLERVNNLIDPTEVSRNELLKIWKIRNDRHRNNNKLRNKSKRDRKSKRQDYRRYKEHLAKIDSLKIAKPVLWSAQFIICDVKRTNITRRINESLIDGQITGKDLVRVYTAVGLALNDRRQLSKRLVSCDLISRKVSTRKLETLVKAEILKVNTRIAGTKVPQLTLVAETLNMRLDDLYPIYKKLSTQESIDRRNMRAETIID